MDSQQKSVRSCYVAMRRLPPCTTVTSPSSSLTPDESDSEPSPSRKSVRSCYVAMRRLPPCTTVTSPSSSLTPDESDSEPSPSRKSVRSCYVAMRRLPPCTTVTSPSSSLTPDESDSEPSPSRKSVRSCYVAMRRLPPCTTVTSPSSSLTPDESDSEPSPSRKSDRPVDDLRRKNPTRKCTLPDSTKKSCGPGDVQYRRNPPRSCTAIISPSSTLTPDVSDSEVSPPKKSHGPGDVQYRRNPSRSCTAIISPSSTLTSDGSDSEVSPPKKSCGPGDVQYRRNPPRSCSAVISPSSALTPDVSDSEVSPPKKCFRRSEGTHIQNPNQAARSCALSPITRDSQLPEQKEGCIVFAKIWSYRLWPGVTFHGPSVGLKTSPVGHTWVFWFGDHKVSVVPFEKTTPFVMNFENVKIKSSSKSLYDLGVMEGIKACGQRCGKIFVEDEESLTWAQNGFCTENIEILLLGGPLPDLAVEHLEILKQHNLRRASELETDDDDEQDEENEEADRITLKLREVVLSAVKEGTKKVEDTCLSCCDDEVVFQHPFFCGGLCFDCKDRLMDGLFQIGEDGNKVLHDFSSKVFCVICGHGGTLFICDEVHCGKVYCQICVKLLVGGAAIESIESADTWNCFSCTDYTCDSHGLIQAKSNFLENVINMFNNGYQIKLPPTPATRKPIRVLSLFDGIGTGKLILDRLGIEVEQFFASEIDKDAINVSAYNLNNVTQIGDVTELDRRKINELGKIDLLIGGSPCNELSLCNPVRKGLYGGTGRLFFHYYRILKILQESSGHVFFMFENVAAMQMITKDTISIFLGSQPAKWDAKTFSAMERSRYFWGNIPGLFRPLPKGIKRTNLTLQNVLLPNLQRDAMVSKIRTVTTKSNSLLQTKGCAYPVKMGDREDTVWPQELERIFGFPVHYTDVGNISRSRRLELLGKSWSVPVVEHLLSPLRDFFLFRAPQSTSDNQEIHPMTRTE